MSKKEDKVPESLKAGLLIKKNRSFLRRLFRLPAGATKEERGRVLNSGSKEQRSLLIHILHQIVKGIIPMQAKHSQVILQSGKVKFLRQHFLLKENVKSLLGKSDQEQKEVLIQVNNFHVLLNRLFHQR